MGKIKKLSKLPKAKAQPSESKQHYKRLEEDYKGLARCLGKKGFSQLIQSYVNDCPSLLDLQDDVGKQLPEYLARWKSPLKQPWQVDLARLERSIYLAHKGRETESWDLSHLAKDQPERAGTLQFGLEGTASLHRSEWSINEVWQQKRSIPAKSWCYLLVYRFSFNVKVSALSAEECALLRDIVSGLTLSEILDLYPDQTTLKALTQWASQGVIKPVFRENQYFR